MVSAEIHALDGILKRRWEFETPQKDGSLILFPFRFWSIALVETEMGIANVQFSVNNTPYICSVLLGHKGSVLLPCTKQKNPPRRSYLFEVGFIKLMLIPPHLPSAVVSMSFFIDIRGDRTEFPSQLTLKLLKSIV